MTSRAGLTPTVRVSVSLREDSRELVPHAAVSAAGSSGLSNGLSNNSTALQPRNVGLRYPELGTLLCLRQQVLNPVAQHAARNFPCHGRTVPPLEPQLLSARRARQQSCLIKPGKLCCRVRERRSLGYAPYDRIRHSGCQ